VIEVLVAEEHDLPFQEGVSCRFQLLRRQWPGQVNASDFRTYMKSERKHLDHWHPS
jgi:hypothetical protein